MTSPALVPIGARCLSCEEPITVESAEDGEAYEWGGEFFHSLQCADDYGECCGRPISHNALRRALIITVEVS